MAKKQSLTDLDADLARRLDDRWTYAKLKAQGWEDRGIAHCRKCGDEINIWRHHEKGRWLILTEGSLEPHVCL